MTIRHIDIVLEFSDSDGVPLTPYRRRLMLRTLARVYYIARDPRAHMVCFCWHDDVQHVRGTGRCTAVDDNIGGPTPCGCRRLHPVPESYPLDI